MQIFIDSCAGGSPTQSKYPSSSGGPSYSSTSPRTTGGFSLNPATFAEGPWDAAVATFIAHFGFKVPSTLTGASTTAIASFRDSAGNVNLTIYAVGTGVLQVVRGSTYNTNVLGSTPAGSFIPGAWHHCQLKVVCALTATGSVEMKVDNVSLITATSVQTCVTNATCDRCRWQGGTVFSDIWIVDSSGTVNNDFKGDVVVEGLRVTGAGSSTQFTPSAGSNYQNVDDPSTPNDDTDFNSSSTPGQVDLFALADPSRASGSVFAVTLNHRSRKDDAGTRQDRGVIKLAGTVANGATRSLSTSYVTWSDKFEMDPGGGGWSIADVAGLEVGYEIVA